MVFLWHFWATINALSDDFIWMKASPEGRPCRQDRGRNGQNKQRAPEYGTNLPTTCKTGDIFICESYLMYLTKIHNRLFCTHKCFSFTFCCTWTVSRRRFTSNTFRIQICSDLFCLAMFSSSIVISDQELLNRG